MEGKIIRHGDNFAIEIDRDLLEQAQMGPDTLVDISANGDTITIRRKVREVGPEEIQPSLEKVNARYSRALKRLAE
jgi:antitoxin component of MazEF toxin-antitoxin module